MQKETYGYVMPQPRARAQLGPAAGRQALPLPCSTADYEKPTQEEPVTNTEENKYIGILADNDPELYDYPKPSKLDQHED